MLWGGVSACETYYARTLVSHHNVEASDIHVAIGIVFDGGFGNAMLQCIFDLIYDISRLCYTVHARYSFGKKFVLTN